MCEYWRTMFGKKSGVFLLQSVIHLIFICGILRSFGLILKFTWFFNKVLSNACCKKRKIEQLQAFKTRLGMCDIMSNYMLAQSLVLILTQYEIKKIWVIQKSAGKIIEFATHCGQGQEFAWCKSVVEIVLESYEVNKIVEKSADIAEEGCKLMCR